MAKPNFKNRTLWTGDNFTSFGQQEGYCAGCRGFFQIRNLTIDHIVSRARGCTDHLDNLQLLCGACNSKKSTRDTGGALGGAQAGWGAVAWVQAREGVGL